MYNICIDINHLDEMSSIIKTYLGFDDHLQIILYFCLIAKQVEKKISRFSDSFFIKQVILYVIKIHPQFLH